MGWVTSSLSRRVVSCVGGVLALSAALAACASTDDAVTPGDRSGSPVNSQGPEPEQTDSERTCRTAQQKVVRSLEWPLTQVVWLITSDVDGASAEASTMVRHGLDRGEAKLQERCGGLPDELAAVKRTVLATTAGPLDAAGLHRLEQAIGDWADALGTRAPLQGTAAWLRHCRELGADLRAGYTLGWSYTPGGRRWWVQVMIDSDLSTRVWADLGGTLWATGLPRNPYSRNDGRGGQEVEWGGSSADSMYAQPFTRSTTQVYLPGPAGYLHTSAGGRVYGVRPEVFVRHGGPACSLPAPRLG